MQNSDHSVAEQFGAFLREAATAAGYDLTPGAGGRKQLAHEANMSPSAIGRTLDGKTLPRPSRMEPLAKAVHLNVRTLLIKSGAITDDSWTDQPESHVRSTSLTPEEAADIWGISDRMVRKFLISSIEKAIQLQNEADQTPQAGGADARG